MVAEAKKVMPATLALIGGKDRYNKIYESIFGQLPKVTEAIALAKKTATTFQR